MVDRLHLKPRHRAVLEALLQEHLTGVEVWAYGSRVNGKSHDGSDLDLVLRGPGLGEIPAGQLGDFEEAVRESTIPFLIEARDWARLPERFQREIEREYVVVHQVQQTGRSVNWQEMMFNEAFLVNPPIKLKRGENFPFVDMASLIPGSRSTYSRERRLFTGGGSRFIEGDTLMARITPCLENGKIARYRSSGLETRAHGSTEFIVIRGRSEVTCSGFAYYISRSEPVRRHAISQMSGTSGRQRVPLNAFTHLAIRIPPLPEQRAIAHILGTLDDKIELNRRMNATLEAMARAIFKDWFVDFGPTRAKAEDCAPYLAPELWNLFPDTLDDEDKPIGWEVHRLADYLELIYGKSLPAKRRNPGPVAVYGSGGLMGRHDAALIQGPAVIVGRKGTVGSLYWEDGPVFPIDTVFYVRTRMGSLLFNYHLLASQPLSDMNTDAAVPGLNRNNAYRLEFPNPGARLVSAFGEIAGFLWKRRRSNLQKTNALTQTRDLLLPKLISGEIRLRDAEKMVEAVA